MSYPNQLEVLAKARDVSRSRPRTELQLATSRANAKKVFVAIAAAALERTHCQRGHPFSGDNLRIVNGKRLCRACRLACHKKANASGNIGRAVIHRVIEAAYEGKTLQQIDGWHKGAYVGGRVVRRQKLIKFMSDHPKLGGRLRAMFDANKKAAAARAISDRRVIAAPAIVRNQGHDVFAEVEIATRGLHESARDDVRGAIFLAISEGRLKPSELALRVHEFTAAHNRMFSQFVPIVGGFMRSTDQRLFDDGQMTLGETVTRGLWDSD